MNAMRYEAPGSIDEVVALLAAADGDSRILAGGTDLLVQMQSGFVKPGLIVDVKKSPRRRRSPPRMADFASGQQFAAPK